MDALLDSKIRIIAWPYEPNGNIGEIWMQSAAPLIFCIEDDADTREMLEILIREHGYRFASVDNCKAALSFIRENEVAIVLMDNLLPDGSGIDLCREVRQFDRGLPIIFLSGSGVQKDYDLAMEVGANAFLTKPYSLEELFSLIDRLKR